MATCAPLTQGRKFNFSAGPSMLPESVLLKAQAEFMNYQGVGWGVMEMSHRSKEYQEIAKRCEKNMRDILGIPDKYLCMFLQGGATGQFAGVPLNILGKAKAVDYVVTGNWSLRASKEAKRMLPHLVEGAAAHIAATSEDSVRKGIFEWAPAPEEWKLTEDAAYVAYCDNETVHGVEYSKPVKLGKGVNLVGDLSSNFCSRAVNVEDYAVIFAGAQKNVGPAGVTITIVRDDLLDKASPVCPDAINYKIQGGKASMLNTPPTYTWYMIGLCMDWIKENGGVDEIDKRHKYMSDKVYDFVDASKMFKAKVRKDSRSRMNMVFNLDMEDEKAAEPTKRFIAEAAEVGLCGLKGYRTLGGFRASMYNGMPVEGCERLVEFMKVWEEKNEHLL